MTTDQSIEQDIQVNAEGGKHSPKELAFEYVMPCCGLHMTHKIVDDAPQQPVAQFLSMATARLNYWLSDRVKRHRCELVSPENIYGLAPVRCVKP